MAENYIPIEFVTLKDGSEGLLIFNGDNKKYKFLDPFHPSDAVDTTNDITDGITYDIITNCSDIHKNIKTPKNMIITKSNKKLYIKENNVWITDGLKEDSFLRCTV